MGYQIRRLQLLQIGASIPSEENLIRKVSSIGIPCVELAYFPPLEGRTDSIRDVLRSSGVKATSFHAPYGVSYDVGNFDPDRRKIALDEHRKCIGYCASLGSEYYVIHPGFDNYFFSRGGIWDDVKKVAAFFPRDESSIGKLWEVNAFSLAELADFAAGVSVKVTLETGPPNIMTPEETISVVRMVDRDNLGVCLDTGHVNVGGVVRPADAIREVDSLLWTLHLHDNMGDGDFHLVPGRGSIDWKGVAEALEEVSYRGVLNLELPHSDWNSEETWADIREGASFLQNAFA